VREQEGLELAAGLGDCASFRRLDVSDVADWDKVIAHCEQLGGLHGLVNNAGSISLSQSATPIRNCSKRIFGSTSLALSLE